jgi:post-segregation antitoxin (ccd killing protein)
MKRKPSKVGERRKADVTDRLALNPKASAAEAPWRAENREAIETYNARIERDGAFGDRFRRF